MRYSWHSHRPGLNAVQDRSRSADTAWLLQATSAILGVRAFDVIMVLPQADGALVTKEELISRLWPSLVVSEQNLRQQVHALRKRSPQTAN
jgi:DNA-binding winged helix-turn-helix (wHTH) protein